jgi:hypothetical protein
MDENTGGKPLWSKLLVWIAYAPLTAVLLLFLGVMMAGEWMQVGWWNVRRLAGRTDPDDRPPPRVWTIPPEQPRKCW